MHDDNKVGEAGPQEQPSVSSKSYGFLLHLSKRLGTVATHSFVEVRDFLNQEVPLPSSTERFLNNMPKLHLKRDASQSDESKADAQSETKNQDSQSTQSADKKKKQLAKKGDVEVDPTQRLKSIVKQSHEILATANTVFPVSIFPDTVFVDRTKVTIIRRSFFWSQDVMSIRIEDVLNVSASVGPLFGSLTIASRVMSTVDHFQINYFWRSDASHLKHIIQGYVIAQHNKIDTAHLSKEELVQTLEELGHDSNIG